MRKKGQISLRLSKGDYDWLRLNATETSFFVRNLIQEARKKEEGRPSKERITETRNVIKQEESNLERAKRNAWSDTPEVQAIINYHTKAVKRLNSKLTMLQGQKV